MDKEILHEETIAKSVLVEISAFETTSWEASCSKEIKDKCLKIKYVIDK